MTTDTAREAGNKVQAPKDATPKVTEPTSVQKEPAPKEAPRTYSQEEVDKIIQHTRMESGRERKLIEMERDQYKGKHTFAESKLTDIQEDLVSLEKRIEELSSNDPELNSLEKRAKALREQERTAKTRLHEVEAKETAYGERLKRAEAFELEVLMQTVADEFEDGDFNKLKNVCQTLEAATEEKVRAVAETLFSKPEVKSPSTGKPYSGVTSGGTGFVRNKANPTETLIHGFEKLKQRT